MAQAPTLPSITIPSALYTTTVQQELKNQQLVGEGVRITFQFENWPAVPLLFTVECDLSTATGQPVYKPWFSTPFSGTPDSRHPTYKFKQALWPGEADPQGNRQKLKGDLMVRLIPAQSFSTTITLEIIEVAYVRDTGAQTGSDIDTDTASFGSLPASGNSVFVLASKWDGAQSYFFVGDVTDNQSNSYALDARERENVDNFANFGIFSDLSIGSPSGTFTLTLNPFGSNNVYVEWIGVEFSGLTALDQTNTAFGTSTTPTVTSGTTTQADELVIGCLAMTSGVNPIGIDLPAGYTQLYLHDSAADTIGGLGAYKIVSSTGAQTFDGGTVSAATIRWVLGVATYKATGGAPADNIYAAQIGVTLQAMNRGATF